MWELGCVFSVLLRLLFPWRSSLSISVSCQQPWPYSLSRTSWVIRELLLCFYDKCLVSAYYFVTCPVSYSDATGYYVCSWPNLVDFSCSFLLFRGLSARCWLFFRNWLGYCIDNFCFAVSLASANQVLFLKGFEAGRYSYCWLFL